MEWIHCNKCFTLPSKDISMYFTSCGHVYCHSCVSRDNFGITPDSDNAFQCQICKKATKTLQIGRSMKPEVLAYFRPPQQLIEESLKKIKAVMEFQSYHRNRFSKFQRDRLDKYQQRLLLEQERSATRESSNFYGNRSSSRVPGMNSSMVSISDNNQQQHENSNAPLWPTSSSFNSSIGSHSSARQNHQNTTSNSASYSYHQNNTSNSSLPYRLPPNSSGSVRMEKPQILASYSASRYSSTTSAFSRPTSSMSVRQSQSSSFGSGIGQVTRGSVAPRILNPLLSQTK